MNEIKSKLILMSNPVIDGNYMNAILAILPTAASPRKLEALLLGEREVPAYCYQFYPVGSAVPVGPTGNHEAWEDLEVIFVTIYMDDFKNLNGSMAFTGVFA